MSGTGILADGTTEQVNQATAQQSANITITSTGSPSTIMTGGGAQLASAGFASDLSRNALIFDGLFSQIPAAPVDPELGQPMELHHVIPRRDRGSNDADNLKEVWRWEHDSIDSYRHTRGQRLAGS